MPTRLCRPLHAVMARRWQLIECHALATIPFLLLSTAVDRSAEIADSTDTFNKACREAISAPSPTSRVNTPAAVWQWAGVYVIEYAPFIINQSRRHAPARPMPPGPCIYRLRLLVAVSANARERSALLSKIFCYKRGGGSGDYARRIDVVADRAT